jgi:hypothetical protein
MAARLRHIALSVSDPEKAAEFFEDAFGMKRVGKAGRTLKHVHPMSALPSKVEIRSRPEARSYSIVSWQEEV